MAGSLLSRMNLARVAQIAALLLFFLPWATVSCSPRLLAHAGVPDAATLANAPDVTLARATGFQLATGTVPLSDQARTDSHARPNPFAKPDPPVAGGALVILLSLAASFLLRGRRAGFALAAGSAVAAGALCYAIFIQLPEIARTAFAASGAGASGVLQADAAELVRMIRVEPEIGFWLTVAALAAAIVLVLLDMRNPAPAAVDAAPLSKPPPIA
jgi:hypothetical protein